MSRLKAVLGSAVFLVVAPGSIAGYFPWLITRWRVLPPFLDASPLRWVGVIFIAAGLPALLAS